MSILTDVVKDVLPGVASLLGGPLAGGVVSFLGNELLGDSSASESDIAAAVSNPANAVKIAEINAKLKLGLADDAVKEDLAQDDINKISAASGSLFLDGGRAAIIWIGALIILNNYVLVPYIHAIFPAVIALPAGEMMPILTSLLGLGGMHVYQQLKK